MNCLLTGRAKRLVPKIAHLALSAGPMLLVPSLAFAQTVTGGSSPTTTINNVCTFLLGGFGQSVAALAVMGLAALGMTGRMSLHHIGQTVGGIILFFGAVYLVQTFTGGAT